MSTPRTDDDGQRALLVAAHEDAAEFYRRTLLGPEGDGPRRYLIDRGFAALLDDSRWTVGYAPPGWTRLRDHLTNLGYSDETLLAAGLTCLNRRGTPIDCFRDRITFGIRDANRQLVGFTARCSPEVPAHVPKYLNTRTTAIYDKSQVVFGLGEATSRRNGAIVLTEGPLDAIAVDLADIDPIRMRPLALCGTALTQNHRAAIAALEPSQVILALDADEAGAQARENAYRVLRTTTDITAIPRHDCTDLAETLRRNGPQGVNALLNSPRPAIDAIIDARLATWPNRTNNAEAGLACLRSLARLVGDLRPADMARQAIRLRESIQLPTDVVTRELAEAITTR
jgi:DNA primase catalytic core